MANTNIIPVYLDLINITVRTNEVGQNIPSTSWDGGCNLAASNANGIGIGTNPDMSAESKNWTLLDQAGVARTPQKSQQIGLTAEDIDTVTNSDSGDGAATPDGSAQLATLAAGWVSVAPVA